MSINIYQKKELESLTHTEAVKDEIKEAAFSKDIERLINKARTEEEQLAFAHANELTMIQNFLETTKNLTNEQILELNELKEILGQKYLDDLQTRLDKELKMEQDNMQKKVDLARSGKIAEVDLEGTTQDDKNKIAKAGMRSALEGLSGHNKAMFQLNKAFKIKDAIMDGIAGVQKALALGPFGIPLAVMIGALTAANVATIASTNYTGRRTGGQVTGGTPYMVGEQGPELFVPNQSGNVKPNSSLGGTVVNFNINTVDARGFNELLVGSRGMIVNLINTAVNEKGRPAII